MTDRYEVREVLRDDPRFLRRAAFDTKLQCDAMLEQPGPSLRRSSGDEADERFLREARSLAGIEHESVVRLRDVTTIDGVPTLVLELPDGLILADALADRPPLSPEEVRQIGLDIAAAAGAIHRKGVVHRGIAPENIFVQANGRAKLTGFTFAKLANTQIGASSIQHVLGRSGTSRTVDLPTYAAPEQLAGRRADHRADLFALGCVLYRAMTGHEAFPLDSTDPTPPPPPHKLVPGCPEDLSRAILKCLAHAPRERFANADEAIAALTRKQDLPSPTRIRGATLAATILAVAALTVTLLTPGESAPPSWRGRVVVAPPGDQPATYKSVYGKSRAIVIGCNYEGNLAGHRALKNAEGDAVAVHSRLVKLGFESCVLLAGTRPNSKPATEAEIRRAIHEQSHEWDREDRLVIYFAGHGELHPFDGRTFMLLPADAGDARSTEHWIHLVESWGPYLAGSRTPKHVLVILDCCHAGAATRSSRALSFGVTPEGEMAANYRARRSIERKARWILTATMEDELGADGMAGDHSPFTHPILELLDRAVEGKPVGMLDLYDAANRALDQSRLPQKPLLAPIRGEESRAEFWLLPPSETEEASEKAR